MDEELRLCQNDAYYDSKWQNDKAAKSAILLTFQF